VAPVNNMAATDTDVTARVNKRIGGTPCAVRTDTSPLATNRGDFSTTQAGE
jgi:hypothetical protein